MPPFLMNFEITFNFAIVLIVLTGTKIMKITHICKIIMIINVKCIAFLFSDELSVGTVVYGFNLIEIKTWIPPSASRTTYLGCDI